MKNHDKAHQIIEDFEEKTGYKVVYVTASGSKLYGTDTELSDTDYKGIFIPTKRSVLLKNDLPHYTLNSNNSKEKNSSDDIDFQLHSIYTWFNGLKKSETGSVDILFSMWHSPSTVYENTKFTNLMKNKYNIFLNKNVKSFIGYALGQTKKFGIKGARYSELDKFVKLFADWTNEHINSKMDENGSWDILKDLINKQNYKYIKFVKAAGPKGSNHYNNEIEYLSVLGKLFSGNVTNQYVNERIVKLYDQFGNRTKTVANTASKTDFKALSHALRVALETEELLKSNFIKFPLKDSKLIKDVKLGLIDVSQVIDNVQQILENVDVLLENSLLPENVNEEIVNTLLLEILDVYDTHNI